MFAKWRSSDCHCDQATCIVVGIAEGENQRRTSNVLATSDTSIHLVILVAGGSSEIVKRKWSICKGLSVLGSFRYGLNWLDKLA